MLIFDGETNGFLENVTKAHCLNMIDRTTGERLRFTDHKHYSDGTPTQPHGSIKDALVLLERAPVIAGQNIIKYDVPVFDKLQGFKPAGKLVDTLVASRIIWPNLMDLDFAALRAGKLPQEFQKKGLIGMHSLKAWGYRLGLHKGDFDPKDFGHTWETVPFLKEMDDYCMQDCEVTLKWIERIESKNYSPRCLDMEFRVAEIIAKQERNGFGFDVDAAESLYVDLQKQKLVLEEGLRDIFPPWQIVTKRGIAKVNNKKLGRVKGEPYEVRKTLIFNPGSTDHIADRLTKVRGWKPSEFTTGGKPQVTAEILSSLDYPEAVRIAEYLVVAKRLGQLGDGKEAWLKAVRDGRIHGSVNTNGAVTGRMTHSRPNVAQADKWPPMRALWIAMAPNVLVGCDAEGLELRALGHYMAAYDGGAYADAVVNGQKSDKTDVHSVNQFAVGLNSRDSAKTFIYALIYGAGDFKLGGIVYEDFTEEQKAKFNAKATDNRDRALATLGKARRKRLMDRLPALAKLTDAVKAKAKSSGHLKGLDGRLLHVRSDHAALNTLLQSAGAIAMKQALVILADELDNHPIPALRETLFVANVHDEFQMEIHKDHADTLGQLAADAIRRAGEYFNLRCPLAGAYDVGPNWASTH
jgi:DNA polymerase I-like protein with 3'-5' exonuclease and polymerase domains